MKIIGTIKRTETFNPSLEHAGKMFRGRRFELQGTLPARKAIQDNRTDAEMVDATLRALIGNVQ